MLEVLPMIHEVLPKKGVAVGEQPDRAEQTSALLAVNFAFSG